MRKLAALIQFLPNTFQHLPNVPLIMCDHSYNQIAPTFVELLIEIRDLEVGGQRLLRGRESSLLVTNFCFVLLHCRPPLALYHWTLHVKRVLQGK